MRSFNTKLTAILTVAALGLATTSAFADGNKGKKSGGIGISFGGGGGGIGVSFGNGNKNHNGNYNKNNKSYHNNNHCGNNGGYPGGGYPYVQPYGQGYEPFHSSYICQPGDSFYTVSLKEYGTGSVANHIAQFNRLPMNARLVAGQRLMLPSISANGGLSASRAPALRRCDQWWTVQQPDREAYHAQVHCNLDPGLERDGACD